MKLGVREFMRYSLSLSAVLFLALACNCESGIQESPLTSEIQRYKFIDLFAGIGGVRLGFESTHRCDCVFSSEWDNAARKTYEANHGHVDAGDITKVNPEDIPDFDILTGGFPCQPFSSIGKRQGFEHPTQGTLFFYIQKILKEKRPKAFLLENVPGLISHQNGETLQVIRDVLRDELGYVMDFKVLDAADFGVPQYRKRLYIIGFRMDLPVYVEGADSAGGIKISKDDRKKEGNTVFAFPVGRFKDRHIGFGQFIEKDAEGPSVSKHLQDNYLFKKNDGHPQVVDTSFDKPVKTLCASYHKVQRLTGTFVRGGKTGLRMFTESECKYLMGFPQDFKVPVSRSSMYHQFGNAVVIPVIAAIAKNMVETLDNAQQKPR